MATLTLGGSATATTPCMTDRERRSLGGGSGCSGAPPPDHSSKPPAAATSATAPAANAEAAVMQACAKCVFEALPKLREEQLVDVLEFVAAQHTGKNFSPDNASKALEVCAFVRRRPFAVTAEGVAALARLARHALGSSTGNEKSTEHKLWLLTSGALNTAAAIRAHDGDALVFFDALQRDAGVRGRYSQRQYATKAMQEHVLNPNGYLVDEDPDAMLARKVNRLGTVHLCLCAFFLVLSVFVGIVASSETFQGRALTTIRGWLVSS